MYTSLFQTLFCSALAAFLAWLWTTYNRTLRLDRIVHEMQKENVRRDSDVTALTHQTEKERKEEEIRIRNLEDNHLRMALQVSMIPEIANDVKALMRGQRVIESNLSSTQ